MSDKNNYIETTVVLPDNEQVLFRLNEMTTMIKFYLDITNYLVSYYKLNRPVFTLYDSNKNVVPATEKTVVESGIDNKTLFVEDVYAYEN